MEYLFLQRRYKVVEIFFVREIIVAQPAVAAARAEFQEGLGDTVDDLHQLHAQNVRIDFECPGNLQVVASSSAVILKSVVVIPIGRCATLFLKLRELAAHANWPFLRQCFVQSGCCSFRKMISSMLLLEVVYEL